MPTMACKVVLPWGRFLWRRCTKGEKEKLQVSLCRPPSFLCYRPPNTVACPRYHCPSYCRCLQCRYPRSKSLPTSVSMQNYTLSGYRSCSLFFWLLISWPAPVAVDNDIPCGHKHIPALRAQSMPPVDITSLQSQSAEGCRAPMLKKKAIGRPQTTRRPAGEQRARRAAWNGTLGETPNRCSRCYREGHDVLRSRALPAGL